MLQTFRKRIHKIDAACSPPGPLKTKALLLAFERHARDAHLYLRKGTHVNKSELIEAIAKHADISKASATRALDAAVNSITGSLKKGSMVTLVGFGTFYVGKRAARGGRNPRTGASIKIKAARVPKFRPGKALKDALN